MGVACVKLMASPAKGPVWSETAKLPAYAPLTADVTAMSASLVLVSPGSRLHICLPKLGSQWWWSKTAASAAGRPATTAHLVNALDDRFFELEWYHGERGSRLAAESHLAAIDRVESIVSRERIACDFIRLDGYLFCAPGTMKRFSIASWRRSTAPACITSEDWPRADLVRHGPVPALSEPGTVPSAEISRGVRGSDRARRRTIYTGRTQHRSRVAQAPRWHPAGPSVTAASSSRPTAGQRSRHGAYEAGPLHDLRGWRWCRAARSRRRSTGTPAIRITTSGW